MHDLSAKLDTFGIYTTAEVDQCAKAYVEGKDRNQQSRRSTRQETVRRPLQAALIERWQGR